MNEPLNRRDLEEKILSKRQQIEFEANNLRYERDISSDNRENPDVMEESKNFDDPAENAVESADLKALRSAESDLTELLKQLKELDEN
ncbi:hypothetical protein [Dyadobacter crusticola]|uniref:hypothetical protein n=1 Tax=Dyadobacter crusticola TaxID=292407 RepID=UPI0004E23892|nr:hypothetical protein [Dyadobacter crusticola]